MAFQFFMKKRPGATKAAPPVAAPEKKHIAGTASPVEQKPEMPTGGATFAFIDASNLFWGGREQIGFKISYSRLLKYLEKHYGVTKAFYYGGVRIFDFEYSILDNKPLDLAKLAEYLTELKERSEPAEQELVERSLKKTRLLPIA